MALSRIPLTGCLFESHKKVTLLLTRKKNFKAPSGGNPFISTVSRENGHLASYMHVKLCEVKRKW